MVKDQLFSSERRPRLAFLCTHSEKGGVQQIWSDLSDAFSANGYDSRLIALYPVSKRAKEIDELPFAYVTNERPSTPIGLLQLIWKLVKFLRSNRFDIIFTAMPMANILVPVANALFAAAGEVVISHHTPVYTYDSQLNFLDSLVGRTSAVSKVVTVSNTVSASLSGKPQSYRSKAVTIYNALPRNIEAELERLAGQRRHRTVGRVVVATGRLTAQKNYPALIRTSAHLPDVKFLIVGTGADEAELKHMAATQSRHDNVAFLGQRSRAETFDLLAESDIFFQPSLFEGHSLALIEAAKLGMPIIVSNVPVQLESVTLEDGTRCAEAADPADDVKFASLIATVLNDANLFERSAERSKMLGRSVTFQNMYNSYEKLVLGAKPPGATAARSAIQSPVKS